MALFQPIDLRLALTSLEIDAHSDRFGGSAEPYVVPVFFKIDGDRYSAFLRISNDRDPSDGSDPLLVELVSDPPFSPTVVTPAGPFLTRGSAVAGDSIDVSDVRFDTTLTPIPFEIDVLGVLDTGDVLAGATDPIVEAVTGLGVVDVINLAAGGLSTLAAGLLGLDETLESCPDLEVGPDLAGQIEAQFDCLIPGTLGGIFVAMENDDYDEDDVATLQSSVAATVTDTLNSLTASVRLANLVPDPDDHLPAEGEVVWQVIGDLFGRFDPVFWFTAVVGTMWAANDELVGFTQRVHSHIDLAESEGEFSAPLVGSENTWRLHGRLERR